MTLNKDSAAGLGTLAGGVLILVYVHYSIADWSFDSLGASFFPKIAAYGLILFGAILFLTTAREKAIPKKASGYTSKEFWKISIFLLSLFLYVAFLSSVGFVISTTILMLIIYLLLIDRMSVVGVSAAVFFAFIATYLLWLLFTKEFQLILP